MEVLPAVHERSVFICVSSRMGNERTTKDSASFTATLASVPATAVFLRKAA